MSIQNSSLLYRKDIDGLRAIAVLAVLLYHFFPKALPSGFVGVDVFFVISGFLISRILIAGMDSGEFRFFDFYSRRIRRIFPALVVVLLATLLVGWFVLMHSILFASCSYSIDQSPACFCAAPSVRSSAARDSWQRANWCVSGQQWTPNDHHL